MCLAQPIRSNRFDHQTCTVCSLQCRICNKNLVTSARMPIARVTSEEYGLQVQYACSFRKSIHCSATTAQQPYRSNHTVTKCLGPIGICDFTYQHGIRYSNSVCAALSLSHSRMTNHVKMVLTTQWPHHSCSLALNASRRVFHIPVVFVDWGCIA